MSVSTNYEELCAPNLVKPQLSISGGNYCIAALRSIAAEDQERFFKSTTRSTISTNNIEMFPESVIAIGARYYHFL